MNTKHLIVFIVINMNYLVQKKLYEDPLYIKYLRENSHWYKILNRHPNRVEEMIEEMKTRYKMHTSDKITNVMDTVSLVSKIWNASKE